MEELLSFIHWQDTAMRRVMAMRRKLFMVVVLIVVSILLTWLVPLPYPAKVQAVQTEGHVTLVSPTASSTSQSTSPTNSQSTSGNDNTAFLVAIIGAAGLVIAALVGASAVIYQTRHNTQADTKKRISRHIKTKRSVRAYRSLLRSDPHITTLQILDMSHPMSVTSVYVRLRLHREARTGYELEPELLAAEAHHDPNT